MASDLTKFLNPNLYKDRESPKLKALGLSVVGHAPLSATGPTGEPRVVHLPVVEGLVAALAGHVRRVTLDGGTIWFDVAREAYTDAVIAQKKPVTSDVVAGYDRKAGVFSTSVPSTAEKAQPGSAKTELSVVAGALLEAAVSVIKSKGGDAEAARILGRYRSIAASFKQLGELPLSGGKTRPAPLAPSVAAPLAAALGELSFELYDWLDVRGPAGSGTQTPWRTTLVASRPRTGALGSVAPAVKAAASLASKRCDDLAELFTSVDLLDEILAPAAAVVSAVPPADAGAATPPAESELARALRWSSAVGIYTMLYGPPGTGKTHQVMRPSEQDLPVVRVSMTGEADVALAIGDLTRDENGAWVPRLGRIAQTVRYAMLAALLVALRRGARLPAATASHAEPGSRETWDLLSRLERDPEDRGARAELDRKAWPFYPATWRPVMEAYRATGAARVGTTVRLYIDEIFDASSNPDFMAILKILLEDERVLTMERGGAGWLPLWAHNVHFAASGNPDEGRALARALRSRFGVTIGVGYPPREELRRRLEGLTALLADGSAPEPPSYASLDLADARYEPYRFPAKPAALARPALDAILEFGEWTRGEAKKRTLLEGLDPRGEGQVFRLMTYLVTSGEVPGSRDAFVRAASLVTDRLVDVDPLGLPVHDQKKMVTDKVAQLAQKL